MKQGNILTSFSLVYRLRIPPPATAKDRIQGGGSPCICLLSVSSGRARARSMSDHPMTFLRSDSTGPNYEIFVLDVVNVVLIMCL